ncbi:hypothetical protein DOS67_01400, partial [Staphylococcus felis]
ELNISSDIDNKSELAIEVYREFKKLENVNEHFKETINNKLLAGQTSTKWFEAEEKLDFQEIIKVLSNKYRSSIKRIDISKIDNNDDLTTEPTIFGIIYDDKKEELYIRYIYKNRVKSEFSGTNIIQTSIPSFATLYINFATQLIEYRGDAKKSKMTISSFLKSIDKTDNSLKVKEKFDFKVEDVADKLDGILIDTISLPEANIKNDDQKLQGISKVLEAIDEYFQTNNIDNLENALNDVNDQFDNHIDENIMPFSLLLLSGLQTVALASGDELRNTPLYKYLKANLTQTTGFIKIQVTEDNIVNEYTIKVGIQSKSIYFTSYVSENVIKYVRDRLF